MITVENLTKTYGSFVAVDDASFTCPQGSITGFLGPNGAGKSTTLRMVTGLTPPTAGTATIDGRPFAKLPNAGREVGVMLDAAAQHPGRTGAETLRLSAMIQGLPRTRAGEMLERVGLAGMGHRLVGDYSLGMRQRLGIASTLMGDPKILVLDEPANGMDPEGIRWMRELLRDFAARGGTVLLSSHLLSEVQATVDRLIVIGRGKVVAQGSLSELLRTKGTRVRGLSDEGAAAAFRSAGLDIHRTSDGAWEVAAEPATVFQIAAAAGEVLVELRPAESGIEDLFFDLTRGTDRGTPAVAA